ncbi:MAG: phosphatidylserine/phosphatidylglycerophosphate/cardiolipin synthase family protein [Chromatiales bacterium]|nr:MAG: phosphatidylserine/phosphatidylglycerophosphate/cardiolipin synthase family protein [Chromatiales bacterium]
MRSVTQPRLLHFVALLLLAMTAGSCASQRATVEEVSPEGYPTLQGRFAEEGVLEPLVALEAFGAEGAFFISYQSADGVIYGGGNWANRIDLATEAADDDGTYSGPYILPLEYRQREPWTDVPEKEIIPALLSLDQWNRFHEQLFASVVPRTGQAGIVMHFDNDDYFLFYNDAGQFECRLFLHKPANYSVSENINFRDFLRLALPQLELFLQQEGIGNRRVVFSTGDVGAYSLPFLYVNLDLPVAAFMRYAPLPRNGSAAPAGTQTAQSVGHVAQSHLGGLALRPVSSVFRLLFAARDAAVETVRPTWLATLESEPIPEVTDGPGMDLEVWERRLDRITGRPATKGTIEYLIDGEDYFTRLIDALTSAQESILVRTYIFDNDDVAEKIGRLLRRRSAEGLDIKVLLDGFGTILATGTQHETLPEDYVPPESVRRFLEEDSDIDVRQVKNPWLTGDHVKTTIIDDQLAFTGGMNIGREYRYVWHDMMVETRGPVVDILRREFFDAWAYAGPAGDIGYFFHKMKAQREVAEDVGHPMRVLFTRTGDPEIFRTQREAIRSAQRYIYIQNAYFSDDAMLYELARARRRGVDVRVILPLVSNHGAMNQSNVLAANAMLEHGIRVFLYPGMSHIKAAVFDGWACLGSANWDKLSFRTNRELNLATSHPEAVDELLERIFAEDFAQSVELTEPFPARWSDHLMELVADYAL